MNFLEKLFGKKKSTKEGKPLTLVEIEKNFSKAKEYFEQGMNARDNDLAIELFERAIGLNPNYTIVYVNIAKAYYTKGNFEKVEFNIKREYFRKSIEDVYSIHPKVEDLLSKLVTLELAFIDEKRKDYDKENNTNT